MSDIRWLNDHEQEVWRTFMAAFLGLTDQLSRQLQRDSGLPHTYYEILVSLSEAPDRTLRMSELASSSLSSRSRISHAVARLEEIGWVRRRQCEHDKRGQLAELTEEGMAGLEAAAPGHVQAVRRGLFDALSAEQVAALRDISETLVAHLSNEPVWPAADDHSRTATGRKPAG
jgi:DNA-binding MarR family transcriptional regulator